MDLFLWSTAAWQREALSWVDDRLSSIGITRTGEDPEPRTWTWSTVMRLPTDHGDIWFKATSPVTVHEVALYPVLQKAVPHLTLSPLAIDANRGWLLLPYGGTSLMHSVSGDERFNRLEAMLPSYARLQIALMPECAGMLERDVPHRLDIACQIATATQVLTFAHVPALGPLPDPKWNREPLTWMASLFDQTELD